jgi:hypothetical protein
MFRPRKATAGTGASVPVAGATPADGAAVPAASSKESASRETTSRTIRLPENPNARRDTGILAAAVTAVPLLLAACISVIPVLGGVWPTAAGIGVLLVITVVVGVQIVRSARRLLVGQGVDTEIVAYYDDRESGILLKGNIQNVALRVTTIHRIVDSLTHAIPEQGRRDALYRCGMQVGSSWVGDFRRQLPTLEIDRHDVLRQILKWSEYDATAGMGRLTVAVDPRTGEGLVALANSFLSRDPSEFPLNWWFAGYLAGSLNELLGKRVRVELMDTTHAAASTTFFQVKPERHPPTSPGPSGRRIDPRSIARWKVWVAKLRRPLPSEEA